MHNKQININNMVKENTLKILREKMINFLEGIKNKNLERNNNNNN